MLIYFFFINYYVQYSDTTETLLSCFFSSKLYEKNKGNIYTCFFLQVELFISCRHIDKSNFLVFSRVIGLAFVKQGLRPQLYTPLNLDLGCSTSYTRDRIEFKIWFLMRKVTVFPEAIQQNSIICPRQNLSWISSLASYSLSRTTVPGRFMHSAKLSIISKHSIFLSLSQFFFLL